jgi:hypothetical protein
VSRLNPNYEEALEMERDPAVPDSALPTPSSLARRLMFTGEWFTVNGLAAQIGKPNKSGQSLIYQTMGVMKRIGFVFEKRPLGSRALERVGQGRGGPAEIRLRNPGHRPSKATLDAYRREAPNGGPANKAKRTPREMDMSPEAEARRARDRARKRRSRVASGEAKPAPDLLFGLWPGERS